MIKFIQHVPTFIEATPEKKEFKNLADLLLYQKQWLHTSIPRTLCFACSDYDNSLMISSITDEFWWVIGYVEGIVLKEYLPDYRDCYNKKEK